MKLAYFPGCTLKTKAKNFEKTAMSTAKELGIELAEIPKWNCCGAVTSLTQDDIMHHVASSRNLLRVQEQFEAGKVDDQRVVTLCSMCYNTMARTNLRVKDNPDQLEKINTLMYLEENDYKGNAEVVHYLEVIEDVGLDKVKAKIKKPLTGLKVAPYYGCTLLRPKEVSIDPRTEPKIQEELITALGAKAIEFPRTKMCCGSYQTVPDKEAVALLANDILTQAQDYGADIIVTWCPLCAFNLDTRQREVQARFPQFKNIPVIYFTQLMALAFGTDEKDCGFEDHFIDPRPLLKSKGLIK